MTTEENHESIKQLREDLARSSGTQPAVAAVVAAPVEPHANSTDATRGQPLVQRAQQRKAELAALLAKLPDDAKRARGDIETAIATVDDLLTGDLAHVDGMTSASLSRWLETNKHLAEVAS